MEKNIKKTKAQEFYDSLFEKNECFDGFVFADLFEPSYLEELRKEAYKEAN